MPTKPPDRGHEKADVSALEAALVYCCDSESGIVRRRAGKGFCYTGRNGARIRDPAVLDRIKRMAIPPAWTDVWISAHARAISRQPAATNAGESNIAIIRIGRHGGTRPSIPR